MSFWHLLSGKCWTPTTLPICFSVESAVKSSFFCPSVLITSGIWIAAAHEKVKFERIMKAVRESEIFSQNLYPPLVLSLSGREQEVLERFREAFTKLGFELEYFGFLFLSKNSASHNPLKFLLQLLFCKRDDRRPAMNKNHQIHPITMIFI